MVSETSYSTSDAWRRALSVADAIKQTVQGLNLKPQHAWLSQVMNEAADQMRAAVLWAAAHATPDKGSRDGLRPLVVAADAARSDAALASYFLSFLSHERLISSDLADSVASELTEVEHAMDTLSRRIRVDLGFDPYEPG